MKLLGTVISWNPAKQCGTVICRETNPPTRYFLYGSRVISGPEPSMGASVLFDADTRTPQPGKLPFALKAEIVEGAAEILGGAQ